MDKSGGLLEFIDNVHGCVLMSDKVETSEGTHL